MRTQFCQFISQILKAMIKPIRYIENFFILIPVIKNFIHKFCQILH